jgi:hypothetical protein
VIEQAAAGFVAEAIEGVADEHGEETLRARRHEALPLFHLSADGSLFIIAACGS